MITLELEFEPKGKKAPLHGKGFTYRNPVTERHMKTLKTLMKMQYKGEPLEGAIKVEMISIIKRPKSVSEKKRKYPHVKPDLDNIAKLLNDSANKILWLDDAQICELNQKKVYGERGRIILKFGLMPE